MDGLTVAVSAASTLFGAGVVWGSLRAKFASLEKLAQKHEAEIDAHTQAIHRLELKEVETRSKLERLDLSDRDRGEEFEQLKSSVVTRELFQSETKGQNRRLEDIINRLSRSQTPASGFRRPDAREESDPPLPPPRPRLPSRRDGE